MALPVTAGLRLTKAIIKHGVKLRKSYGRVSRKKYSATGILTSKIKTAASETKRHLKFYSKVISPQGTQFKNLIARPTFGQKTLFSPGAKPGSKFANVYVDKLSGISPFRKKLAKVGIIGGIGYAKAKS